jgi:hypothetical protein
METGFEVPHVTWNLCFVYGMQAVFQWLAFGQSIHTGVMCLLFQVSTEIHELLLGASAAEAWRIHRSPPTLCDVHNASIFMFTPPIRCFLLRHDEIVPLPYIFSRVYGSVSNNNGFELDGWIYWHLLLQSLIITISYNNTITGCLRLAPFWLDCSCLPF